MAPPFKKYNLGIRKGEILPHKRSCMHHLNGKIWFNTRYFLTMIVVVSRCAILVRHNAIFLAARTVYWLTLECSYLRYEQVNGCFMSNFSIL